MIRLTNEENPFWRKGGKYYYSEEPYEVAAFEEGAKAQLKKVVEWLLDNELHPECDGLELSGKSLLALLEEVKS